MHETETGVIGKRMVEHPETRMPFIGSTYHNNEARVVSLLFDETCFPSLHELAPSLLSLHSVTSGKRPSVTMRGQDFNGGEWSYEVVATRLIDSGGGINPRGEFQIEGVVVGGHHGKWHVGHHLRVSYDYSNNDNPELGGHGLKWHFDNELAIYVPVDVVDRVDCPGHPDHVPLSSEPGAHELCTFCEGIGKIDINKALTHRGYSNLRQERLPSV